MFSLCLFLFLLTNIKCLFSFLRANINVHVSHTPLQIPRSKKEPFMNAINEAVVAKNIESIKQVCLFVCLFRGGVFSFPLFLQIHT